MRRLGTVRLLVVLAAVLLVGAVAAGLSASGDNADEPDAAETTVPTGTTPEAVTNAVWERSYSECGSATLQDLAAKYNIDKTPEAVATAVARAWTRRFEGGSDAIAFGRDGCLRSMQSS